MILIGFEIKNDFFGVKNDFFGVKNDFFGVKNDLTDNIIYSILYYIFYKLFKKERVCRTKIIILLQRITI
jgi:hypothetical protein